MASMTKFTLSTVFIPGIDLQKSMMIYVALRLLVLYDIDLRQSWSKFSMPQTENMK